jgi:hypothetical protein
MPVEATAVIGAHGGVAEITKHAFPKDGGDGSAPTGGGSRRSAVPRSS